MKIRGNQRESIWTGCDAPKVATYPSLKTKLKVDVAIVGGGIAGITAALLLKRAGKSVALLERDRLGSGDTGRTTAHLTQILDTSFYDLAEDFGEEGARLAVDSHRVAIDRIEAFVRQFKLDCDFERVPGFVFTETRRGTRYLKRELKASRKIGVTATLVRDVSLPGPKARAALRIENQGQFHPLRYLAGLASRINGDGSFVFEKTPVTSIEDAEPCVLSSPEGAISATDIIVATHSPVFNRIALQTKIHAYRTYVLAAKVREPMPQGLFWDTEDPYHYVRTYGDLVIIGGEDHKTGMEEDPSSRFIRLEKWARERFDIESISFRWSGQVHEPIDGLAYIGKNPYTEHLYVATGFSGNGMTYGTLSGMILSDAILGIENPYASLYHPSRIKPLASAATFISENVDVPMCFIGDRLAAPEATRLAQIEPGEGKVMRVEGKRVAVYREPGGEIRACSAVCPHMGCLVRWNNAETSWDCPCHGSRFDTDGRVLNGPAATGLEAVPLEEVIEVGRRKRAA